MIKSSLLNNELPNSSINQEPYENPLDSKLLIAENREIISEMIGMFQLEVAERICENEGSKKYGIISVLTQAFYHTEFLFSVSSNLFNPRPKVNSAVIKLIIKRDIKLQCDENLFFKIVKLSFQQRRKTIRNSLKTFNLSKNLREHTIFDNRPEQLSVNKFVQLTNLISEDTRY